MAADKRDKGVVEPEEEEVFDIELEEDILKRNEELANENRRTLNKHGIRAIDVMGSVGSGKTSLIEALADKLKTKYRIGMIAGDVTTTIDADRIEKHGVAAVQVNTGKECHLDANLVKKALDKLNLENLDLLFIENVGNLICPAEFDLGSHLRLVVISVTEGEYMVVKHPYIFRASDVAVINKMDLADAMGIDVNRLVRDARDINPEIKTVKTSLRTGEGVDEVVGALGLM